LLEIDMSKKPAPEQATSARKTGTAGLTDVATLRSNARRNIEKGAVTETYSADKATVIKLLNEALATEWVCVLRYYRHYFMASGMFADTVKAEFLEHGLAQEEEHADDMKDLLDGWIGK
jgi:bacterioferritin